MSRGRPYLAYALLWSSMLALGGCAAGPGSKVATVGTEPEPPRADTANALPPAPPEAASQELDEVAKTSRKLLVGDMMRIGLVRAVEYGPPGTLRVAIGQSFYTSGSKDLYFGKLANAYSRWASSGTTLTIELWDRGRKFGEYADEVFRFGPQDGAGGAPPAAAAAPAAPPSSDGREAGHGGFHAGLGVGGGAAALSCDACDFDRKAALSGFLSLGSTVGENLLLGIEGSGWTKGQGPGKAQIYSLMALLTSYLNESSGVFVSAGLGLVGYHQGTSFGTLSANGFGFSGRVGIEVPLGHSFAVIPYLAYVSTLGGAKLKLEGNALGQDLHINNLQFGAAVGFHPR